MRLRLTVDGIEVETTFKRETKTEIITDVLFEPTGGDWSPITAYHFRHNRIFIDDLYNAIREQINNINI